MSTLQQRAAISLVHGVIPPFHTQTDRRTDVRTYGRTHSRTDGIEMLLFYATHIVLPCLFPTKIFYSQ